LVIWRNTYKEVKNPCHVKDENEMIHGICFENNNTSDKRI